MILGIFQELAAPAEEPVTVPEFKTEARFGSADFDASLIPLRLADARRYFEDLTWIATISRTFRLTLDRFPIGCRELPIDLVPLVSVESITYRDTSGDEQTLDSSLYRVDTSSRPGRVQLRVGRTWPATIDEIASVSINFTAGYGAAETDVPADVKTAILLIARDRFYQPGPLAPDTIAKVDSLRWRVFY